MDLKELVDKLEPRYFLLYELERRKKLNPRYSLRAFASCLGVHSGYLGQVISGKRPISGLLALKIISYFNFEGEARDYFLHSLSNIPKNRKLLTEFEPSVLGQFYRVKLEELKIDPKWHRYAAIRLLDSPIASLANIGANYTDMSDFWKRQGLRERGSQTWVIPELISEELPYSQRYDPRSEFFQSAYGIFRIDNFEHSSEWKAPTRSSLSNTLNCVGRIISATQSDWLLDNGGEDHFAMPINSKTKVDEREDGFYKVNQVIETFSDFGDDLQAAYLQAPFSAFSKHIKPFQPLRLHIQALIKYFKSKNQFIIIYGSAAEYETVDGQVNKPSSEFLSDVHELLSGVAQKEVITESSP